MRRGALAIVAVTAAAVGACGDRERCCTDEALTSDARARPDAPPASSLFSTGLYADVASLTLAPGVRPFAPRHALWSDGAVKNRWIALPDPRPIDATVLDDWVVPVGTKVWKEFASPDGTRLETRLIERRADTGAMDDWWFGSFVWTDDEADAILAPDGATDVRGTAHDVPSRTDCFVCHRGEPGRLLGFSAVQLTGPGEGLRLDDLLDERRVEPAPVGPVPGFPGDAITEAALGTLHASCGHCHNERGIAWPDARLDLLVTTSGRDAELTSLYTTTVGVPVQSFLGHGVDLRIAPGDPDASAVVVRMASRVEGIAMPPLFTEIIDDDGLARVRAWIASLPPPAP